MKNIKKKLAVPVVLLIIAGIVWFFFLKDSGKSDKNELTLYGNVDIRQVNLSFRVPGRVGKMYFDEGNPVKPGEVVAELDAKPYIDEFNISEAGLASAEAILLKLKNGSRRQEIESAIAQVNEREAVYRKAALLYERQKDVVNRGAVSLQALDDSESFKNESYARLETARENLDLLEEGTRYEEIMEAEARVELAKARLESAQTDLNDTKIIAPNAGTVLSRIQEPGAIVNAGSAVYTLSLKSPVWVRAYVEEPDLGRVYPDMKAKVFTDSRPDKPYEGHIGFISPVAEFTPKSVETTELRTDLVYRLRVVVDNPDEGLRQGMPVTVKIRLKNKADSKNAK